MYCQEYTVKASGDIYVNGAVEGATLISGQDCIEQRYSGKGKGMMQAEGDIISILLKVQMHMPW